LDRRRRAIDAQQVARRARLGDARRTNAQLSGQGRRLLLARCKQHVRDLLARAQTNLDSDQRSFWSVDEAVEAAIASLDEPRK
jgi:hypothetical protein